MGDERHCIARLGSSADARPLGIILSKRNDSFLIHHRARLWADGTTRCSAGRRTGWARCVVAMTISSRQKGQDKEDAERGGKWARWLCSRKAASPGRAAAKFALRANICTCAFCAIPQTCKIRTSGFDYLKAQAHVGGCMQTSSLRWQRVSFSEGHLSNARGVAQLELRLVRAKGCFAWGVGSHHFARR